MNSSTKYLRFLVVKLLLFVSPVAPTHFLTDYFTAKEFCYSYTHAHCSNFNCQKQLISPII